MLILATKVTHSSMGMRGHNFPLRHLPRAKRNWLAYDLDAATAGGAEQNIRG